MNEDKIIQKIKEIIAKRGSIPYVVIVILLIIIGVNYNNNKQYSSNMAMADNYMAEGKFGNAMENYNIALSYKDNSAVQEKIAKSSKLYIAEEFEQAKTSASKADYQKAIDDMSAILNIDANNNDAKVLKAQYKSDLVEVAKQQEINTARSAIRVISLYPSNPNSADGVDLHIVWRNNSNKVIKYVSFEVTPYNAVGDAQKCQIRDDSTFRGKVTGPINPGVTYGYGYRWECAWYNNSIKSVKLNSIIIIYMDGSITTLDQNQVQDVFY